MNNTSKFFKSSLTFTIAFLAIIVISTIVINEGTAQSTYQTWNIIFTTQSGSHSGTLNVLSDGDFTSSGLTGSTSEGTYEISLTGWMSGTSISFTESASYDHGNGYIYGDGSGTLNAAFPSATSGSGIVSGTISDPLGGRSFSISWTATKTSGGSGGGGNGGSGSLFGTNMLPFIAIAVMAVAIAATLTAVKHVTNSKRANRKVQGIVDDPVRRAPPQMRHKMPMNYSYGPPNPPDAQAPTGMQGSLIPQPITLDNGIPITGQGASVVPPELGGLPFLNATWPPGRANLSWGTPQYDPSKYALLGYDISQQIYGPTSTAAQNVYLGRAPFGTNQTSIQFNQTFRWNTAGDIGGFRVDPVFGQITPTGQIGPPFNYGGLGVQVPLV